MIRARAPPERQPGEALVGVETVLADRKEFFAHARENLFLSRLLTLSRCSRPRLGTVLGAGIG